QDLRVGVRGGDDGPQKKTRQQNERPAAAATEDRTDEFPQWDEADADAGQKKGDAGADEQRGYEESLQAPFPEGDEGDVEKRDRQANGGDGGEGFPQQLACEALHRRRSLPAAAGGDSAVNRW